MKVISNSRKGEDFITPSEAAKLISSKWVGNIIMVADDGEAWLCFYASGACESCGIELPFFQLVSLDDGALDAKSWNEFVVMLLGRCDAEEWVVAVVNGVHDIRRLLNNVFCD